MTDRELLEKLFNFLAGRKFIQGDDVSIMDMVKRYKNPPFSRVYPIAMQLTPREYDKLTDIFKQVADHLHPQAEPEAKADEPVIS